MLGQVDTAWAAEGRARDALAGRHQSQATYPQAGVARGIPPIEDRVEDRTAREAYLADGHADVDPGEGLPGSGRGV